MNIITITGGLGNQMFQYAVGQLMSCHGIRVTYDVSRMGHGCTLRRFELDQFRVHGRWLDARAVATVWRHRHWLSRLRLSKELVWKEEFPENVFDANLIRLNGVQLHGYFQCEQYCRPIRSQLLREFVLRDSPSGAFQDLKRRIELGQSVSVHVRRGDYVGLQDSYGLCPPSYYDEAFSCICTRVDRPEFFVFSDDLAWARDNLKVPGPVTFVDLSEYGRPALDMMLMRRCRHNIIANSTFSWWGAWLNENPEKLVIAPRMWFSDGRQTDIVPPEWIRL